MPPVECGDMLVDSTGSDCSMVVHHYCIPKSKEVYKLLGLGHLRICLGDSVRKPGFPIEAKNIMVVGTF